MIPAEFLAFVEARAAALTVYLPLLAAVATRLSLRRPNSWSRKLSKSSN